MNTRGYLHFGAYFVTGLVIFSFLISPVSVIAGDNPARGEPGSVLTNTSSVMFIENIGQMDDEARFQVRSSEGTLWLAEDALWVTLLEKSPSAANGSPDQGVKETPRKGVNIRLSFPGANPHPRLEPFNRLDTSVSYFIGNDESKWRSDVPVWGGVRYVDLYPGIDLEISGENDRLVQRLRVHEGVDPSVVSLRIEGSDAVRLVGDALRLDTPVGEYSLSLLQLDRVGGSFPPPSLRDDRVASPFASHASEAGGASGAASTLRQSGVADLLYSTFLGGNNWDSAGDIAVETSGKTYVTGTTYSSNFPATAGSYDTTFNGGSSDVFVAQLNAVGSALTYATFLGGSGNEWGGGIVRDSSGAVYVTGETSSSNFPTTVGALDRSLGGSLDAFVIKLSASGKMLTYASLLGGGSDDSGAGIALASGGLAYVTGYTESSDFPTTVGALDRTLNDYSRDAFVVEMNATGSAFIYGTYLGGAVDDEGYGIAVDSSGAAYVTGITCSPDFRITIDSFDWTYNSFNGSVYVCSDGFLVKLNAAGSALVYGGFLGGTSYDKANGVAVGADGSAYVVGSTTSSNFPTTTGAYDTTFNSTWDAFVVKVKPDGSPPLTYSTFLGGGGGDYGGDIALNASGEAYVTGYTDSSDFPMVAGAFDTTNSGLYDAFASRLNVAGSALAYSTYLGGGAYDFDGGIALDGSGNVHLVGSTQSADFPTTVGALDVSHNGDSDAFVLSLKMGGTSKPRTVLVQDESSLPVSGAQVFRNGALLGTTAGDGTLYISDLVAGDQLVARKQVAGFTYYNVYITSLDIPRFNDPDPFTVTNPFIAQTLTLDRTNTLIGFNVVVSVEWDANTPYLNDLVTAFRDASEMLYDSSDGQMLFEQVIIHDNNRDMETAGYRVYASNQVWPNSSKLEDIWTPRHVELGRYFDGESSNQGNWSDEFSVLVHEFGHMDLGLHDSYFYYDRVIQGGRLTIAKVDGICTDWDIKTNDTPETNATLMAYEYNSTEFAMQNVFGLWTDDCRHTYQWQQDGQSDWETILDNYKDTNSPEGWLLQTPSDHGGVVEGPNSIPVAGWSSVGIGINDDTDTCEPPMTWALTDQGSRAQGADVTLKVGNRTIYQGKADDKGWIKVLGAHAGDKMITTYPRDGEEPFVSTLEIYCAVTADQSQVKGTNPVVVELHEAAFDVDITTAPGGGANEMDIVVKASTTLAAAPETLVTQNGASGVAVTLSYDAGQSVYTGTLTLDSDLPPKGNLLVSATDLAANVVDITALFAIEPVVSAQDVTVRSADNQAELFLPAGSLSGDGRVSLALGQLPGAVPAGHVMLSGPYAFEGDAGLSLVNDAGLSMYYQDMGGIFDTLDLGTLQTFRWDGSNWQALPGTISENEQSVSASISGFGIYALLAQDNTPPSILSIVRVHPSPTDRASVQFTVTFSESVRDVGNADFSLTTTSVTGASIISTTLAATGAARTVTVNTGTGNGTLRLDGSAAASITDMVGNPLAGLPFTTGQIYTVNKKISFSSLGTNDGWILESTETSGKGGTLDATSTSFNLGDGTVDKQYRALLSFNTASLPDTAVITKVTLKIKKQGLVGTNPFTLLGGLKVDIRKPFFGTSLALVVNDFQSFPGKSAVATFGGTPVSNWYSAVIGSAGYPFINKTGTTQFRLRFITDDNDDNSADYMKFFSGNYATASARPALILEYYVP